MPFVTIYVRSGCDDLAVETSMRQITQAGEDILENTLKRMVRVSFFETDARRVYTAGEYEPELAPLVLFRIGPGRSADAKDLFMKKICEILCKNLGCRPENVHSYIMDNEEGFHFCIGGKPKDFGKQVK